MLNEAIHDCLIIGAGPAGLTAAIYLRRFHRQIMVVDNGRSRAAQIPLSNNYPGFPEGVSGADLLNRLREQLTRFEGVVTEGTVGQLEQRDSGFTADMGGELIHARTVLLATGIVDIEPAIPGFHVARESGLIRYCPICDGFEFTDQRIAVLGAGMHGKREAEFIRRFSSNLTLIDVGEDAIEAAHQQALAAQQIRCLRGDISSIAAQRSPGEVSLVIDNTTHIFDTVYCALGSTVHSQLAQQLGAMCDNQRCLQVNAHMETSVSGLFAAGDVVSSLSQLVVAAGQAAVAATAIHNRLNSH